MRVLGSVGISVPTAACKGPSPNPPVNIARARSSMSHSHKARPGNTPPGPPHPLSRQKAAQEDRGLELVPRSLCAASLCAGHSSRPPPGTLFPGQRKGRCLQRLARRRDLADRGAWPSCSIPPPLSPSPNPHSARGGPSQRWTVERGALWREMGHAGGERSRLAPTLASSKRCGFVRDVAAVLS